MNKRFFIAVVTFLLALLLICGTALAEDMTINASNLGSNPGTESDPWYIMNSNILILNSGQSFTINGTIDANFAVVNSGTIKSGTFDGYVENAGIIEGGTFNGYVYNKNTITAGTFSGIVSNNNNGTINGGTFSGNVSNNGNGTINGGTFSGTMQNKRNATVKDGTFIGTVENDGTIEKGTFNCKVQNNTSGTIENGTFSKNVGNKGTIESGTFSGNVSNSNRGTIKSGTFSGDVSNNGTINGGTFSGDVENNGTIKDASLTDAILSGSGTYEDCDFNDVTVSCDEQNPAMAGAAKWHKEEYKSSVYNNDASCTTDGTNTVFCDNCGTVLGMEPALGSAKGHLFSDYIDDNNADCLNDGTKTAVCQRPGCNAKVIMIIKNSALGHDYQPDAENSRPATCIEPGKEVTTCTRCGETFFKATPMVEHDVVDLPAVEPTCTSTGLTLGAKCGVCGKNMVLQEEIPMLAHTPEEVSAIAPTYTKPGYTAGVKCAVCGVLLSGCEEIGVLTPKLSGLALMRKGASQDAGIYFPLLKPSQSFSIIGEMENYFYPILLVNGVTGWLHYSYVV